MTVLGVLLTVLPLIPDWRAALLMFAGLFVAIRTLHVRALRRARGE